MPRSVRDSKLETRTARLRLKPQARPYWRALDPGLHLGYRRKAKTSGEWLTRSYLGHQKYKHGSIGSADDYADADNQIFFSFAQAQVRARVHDKARKRASGVMIGPYTVRECIEEYLDDLEHRGKSARDFRYRAEAHILPAFGDIECSALTKDEITDWHRKLSKESPRKRKRKGAAQQAYRLVDMSDPEVKRQRRLSANRVLTIIKAALERAYSKGRFAGEPSVWRDAKPFRGVERARTRFLSAAEAKRLINTCDPVEIRHLVNGGLLTGCRYGELVRVLGGDFSPDAGTLHIRETKAGKPRHVVLNEEGIALFKQLTAGGAPDQHVFRRPDGKPWGKSHISREFRAAVDRAGLEPGVVFHSLRHTWASLSIMAGAPLMVVAQNLGHADTRMVEKFYGHLAKSYVADTIRKTAPKFGQSVDPVIEVL